MRNAYRLPKRATVAPAADGLKQDTG